MSSSGTYPLDRNGDPLVPPRQVRYQVDGEDRFGPIVGFANDGTIVLVGTEDGDVLKLAPAEVESYGRIEGAVVVDRGPGQPPLII